MMRQLEKAGITSEKLDNLVHETASDMASNVNNDGMKSQIEFLNMAGRSDKRIWADTNTTTAPTHIHLLAIL